MKRKHQIDSIRHPGGRPPPARRTPRVKEEAELTLAPPSRFRSLLVPLDGSPFGEHALPLALGIARRAGASVCVVHVRAPLRPIPGEGLPPHDSDLDAYLRRRQQGYLDSLLRRLAKATDVPLVPLLAEGREVAPSLCDLASAGADLVVMATHGRGLLGRLWHGSVAAELMRGLTPPLVLVRGHDAPPDLGSDPVPRHVLIPLDGSPAAEQAVGPALGLGDVFGTRHTLIRVVHPAADQAAIRGRLGRQWPGATGAGEEAWRYVVHLAERLGGDAARVSPRLVTDERATADAILGYARMRDVDLIAMTTRGRGAWSRLYRASVAEQVARRADVPVLLVRSAESGA